MPFFAILLIFLIGNFLDRPFTVDKLLGTPDTIVLFCVTLKFLIVVRLIRFLRVFAGSFSPFLGTQEGCRLGGSVNASSVKKSKQR